jgi:hypothetical protein
LSHEASSAPDAFSASATQKPAQRLWKAVQNVDLIGARPFHLPRRTFRQKTEVRRSKKSADKRSQQIKEVRSSKLSPAKAGVTTKAYAILFEASPPQSRDGGTGRRSGLKIRRSQGRGGSTPPPGTNKLKSLI